MPRQIKFRVWNTYQKKFHDPSKIAITGNGLKLFFDWHEDDRESWEHDCWNSPNEGLFIVQQFTGFLDKNGVEIYEGDIVEASHSVFDFRYKDNLRLENYSGLIGWHHSYWAIKDYKLSVMEDESLKVIGNIFQNQELLVN